MTADDSGVPAPSSLTQGGAGGERAGSGIKKHPLRTRFEDAKYVAIDDAMGKGDSWAKKVGSSSQGVMLDDIPKLLSALNLKLVDVSRVCITREEIEEYEAYKTIATAHLRPRSKLEQDWDKPA